MQQIIFTIFLGNFVDNFNLQGVIGTIVVNTDGVPIKSTLDNATTVQYSGLLNNLVDQAKTMFKELDPTNDLTFLRIRTKVRKCYRNIMF